jgi:hypothetical protein
MLRTGAIFFLFSCRMLLLIIRHWSVGFEGLKYAKDMQAESNQTIAAIE